MKKMILLAILGLCSCFQVAFADVIPASLVGKWFFDGYDSTTYTAPSVVTFSAQGSTFSEYSVFGTQDGNKQVSCLATFSGTITSVKQTGPASYVLEGATSAVDSIYPMPGSTMQECHLSPKDYGNFHFNISNLKEYSSFELGGSVYKKVG